MSRFLSNRLNTLKAYVPGEQPKPGQYIKLNTNEFPYPPAESVAVAASSAVSMMNLYSDLNCTVLKAEFEKVFGFGGKNVIFTNGSDEALYLCFLAFCGPDCGVAFSDITYGFYSVYADLCGLDKKIIPLDSDFGIDVSEYFGIGKTVFIANPNAPTGKCISLDEIKALLVNNPDNIIVIDEAYADFAGMTCRELTREYDNLVVVGTFSKSRGMAGARLGYIIASEALTDDLERVKFSINPYNVNSLTQAVGAAVLRENPYYSVRVSDICDTREWFSERLKKLGFNVIKSYTNFVFAAHPDFSGEYIAEQLRKNGILIRRFGGSRISNHIRITIGTREEMETVEQTLIKILGGK